jgi:hypothetical protein
MLIEILPSGNIRFIYNDNLRGLMDAGKSTVARASEVEPNEEGQWTADLSRVGGPLLGPFRLREEALSAEIAWLEANSFGEVKLTVKEV